MQVPDQAVELARSTTERRRRAAQLAERSGDIATHQPDLLIDESGQPAKIADQLLQVARNGLDLLRGVPAPASTTST